MPIKGVYLTADAFTVCLTHALTTEKEEIMGLLVGEISEEGICHISAVMLLRRSDKQSDRVEISPEQLSDASSYAENLGHLLEKPMRIVGWYHSHPHITVWPSHIDVRTQAAYQLMDEGFIGLIFSVFNQDKTTKVNRVQVSCFQSVKRSPNSDDYDRIEIDIHIVPTINMCQSCVESLGQLPTILCNEEDESFQKTKEADLDLTSIIHNGTVYSKNMVQIFECLHGPMIVTMENRLISNRKSIERLRKEKEDLKAQLKRNIYLQNEEDNLETAI